jgi:DNA helicase-2/ATP-dependent DNA helicase PcrA
MSWNDGLTPEQRDAARHVGQHARLLAGPGTGKTRTLTSRVAYLITQTKVPPDKILALTFTRAAAAELRSRVAAIIGSDTENVPQISTLHSFALQTILRHGASDRLPSPIRIADDYAGVLYARSPPMTS